MAVQVSYPGVYIDEFAPGAPIQGVSTSTAAFVGVARLGDLDTPVRITSWQGFRETFGEQPVAGFFMWYAVRGFFENGGRNCWVVRASNGTYSRVALANRAGNDFVSVRARDPGAPTTAITVEVAEAHQLQSANTSLYQPTGSFTVAAGERDVVLTDAAEAAQFKPGDWINLGALGTRLRVTRVSGDTLRVETALAAGSGTVRLADVSRGEQIIRIRSTVAIPDGALVPGTMLTIQQGTEQDTQVVQSVQTESIDPADPTQVTYRVTLRQGLDIQLSLDPANPATVESEEFDIVIAQGAGTTYANLAFDPAHPRYYVRLINTLNELVRLEPVEPPPPDAFPLGLPDDTTGPTPLTGGKAEDLGTLAAEDYINALDTLSPIDDVNLVAIPDAVALRTPPGGGAPQVPDIAAIASVQQAIISHCELKADRFGVLDARGRLPLFKSGDNPGVDEQRRSVDSMRGYAALYYPWLRVAPAGAGEAILVPPSGHMCGVIARSDASRGVFKAPANFIVNGSTGVERTMTDDEQGILNLAGINVIRVFNTGERPQIWGARTTATDRNWQYINIRRLFLFLEESIQEGIRWAVFEPNNPGLWQKLKVTIRAFLLQQWRDGALFGNTPEEAFYVTIDDVLNPFSEQALGRLHIEIGVRPSYPAEFIIVHIGIWQGGSEVSEA